ncbi:Cd(II)/Pb(II)-responsive transcriptional regulator [Pasteurella canis]|uniref:MerR family transcriptional regulator n=1 Tax=Pasteurella canis TaxID=753 RepID=UPI001E2C1307|nr:MerR family transcriptional regulator [Pasteurella canis]GJJ81083.1 Cd(II)/Pb(II)-responsive transcriptional regulator [Pasteurella canis]
MTAFFKINELSKKTALHSETIRYYEKIGLLPKPQRGENNYRLYDNNTVQLLEFIKICRTLGFSIEEIKQLHQLQTNPKADCQSVDEMIRHHLNQVQEKIQQLKKIEQFLRTLSTCDEHNISHCRAISGLKMRKN